MSHGVHGVMTLVTMEGPIALFISEKFNLPHLTHSDIGGHLVPARGFGCRAAIRASHEKLMAVQVNRVVGHREISNTDAYFVVVLDIERIDTGEHSAVPAPDVLI